MMQTLEDDRPCPRCNGRGEIVSDTDAERWRRAKEYIDREIEAHERVLDAGGISFDEYHVRSVQREAYQSILEAAEGGEE